MKVTCQCGREFKVRPTLHFEKCQPHLEWWLAYWTKELARRQDPQNRCGPAMVWFAKQQLKLIQQGLDKLKGHAMIAHAFEAGPEDGSCRFCRFEEGDVIHEPMIDETVASLAEGYRLAAEERS